MSQHEFADDSSDLDTGPDATLPKRERDYVIPAQDSHGQSLRLYCRAMPTIGRLVTDVHASKKYPFRTQGDLIRWCIVTGVKTLIKGAGIQSVMAQSDAMIAALQDEEFQLQFKEFFGLLKRIVDTFIEQGAPGEARRVVTRAQAQIESMPDGYWKKKYRDDLIAKYRQMLDAEGAGVSFSGDEHENETTGTA